MVEIGKILGEIGDKSEKICKKRGKRILSTPLRNILDTPLDIKDNTVSVKSDMVGKHMRRRAKKIIIY